MQNDDEPIEIAQDSESLKDHLNKARMAQFIFAPTTPNARALAEHLTSLTMEHEEAVSRRQRKRSAAALRSFKEAVGAFAADLLHHSQFEDAAGFMYRGSDKDLLSETLVSARSFQIIIEHWPTMELMHATSFFRVQETWEDQQIDVSFGRSRRFRSTDRLKQIAARFGIAPQNVREHFTRELGRIIPVTIRSELPTKDGKRPQAANMKMRGPKFERQVGRVREINAILAEGGFDLADPPQVYRLFNRGNYRNFDFNMGGRLYCRSEMNWQQMPKAERSLITCRGELTVELDVRASHLFILYAISKVKLPRDEDPYAITNIERDVVKGLFAAICGRGGRPSRWPKELAANYLKSRGNPISKSYSLSKVLDALYVKHPVLNRIKAGSFDWANLQFEESECFIECLLSLGREHGIAALPIHDSLIVAKRHMDVTLDALRRAYADRFSADPVIRVK